MIYLEYLFRAETLPFKCHSGAIKHISCTVISQRYKCIERDNVLENRLGDLRLKVKDY